MIPRSFQACPGPYHGPAVLGTADQAPGPRPAVLGTADQSTRSPACGPWDGRSKHPVPGPRSPVLSFVFRILFSVFRFPFSIINPISLSEKILHSFKILAVTDTGTGPVLFAIARGAEVIIGIAVEKGQQQPSIRCDFPFGSDIR